MSCLHSEQNQEGNHQREQSSGLSKGEPQNSIREQLSPKGRVPCNTSNQGSKNRANTRSSTNKASCGGSGSDELTGAQDRGSDGDGLGDDATRLAACNVGDRVTESSSAHEQAGVAGSGLETSN